MGTVRHMVELNANSKAKLRTSGSLPWWWIAAILVTAVVGLPGMGHAQSHDIRFDPVYTVGDDERIDAELFGSNVSVALSSEGLLYVGDRSSGEIRLFDSTGTHRRTIGRAGRGPGEFVGLARLALSGNEDTLYVYDAGQRRVSIFTAPDLQHIQDVPVDLRNFGHPLDLHWQRSTRRLLLTDHVLERTEVVHAIALDGTRVQSYAPFLEDLTVEPDAEVVLSQINSGYVTELPDGDLVVALAAPYMLARFAPDGTERWRVTDDIVPSRPWVEYIDYSPESYRSRVYPQVVEVGSIGEDRLLLSIVDVEANTVHFDVRDARSGRLLHRQQTHPPDQHLEAVARPAETHDEPTASDEDASTGRLAVLRDRKPTTRFHIVRCTFRKTP